MLHKRQASISDHEIKITPCICVMKCPPALAASSPCWHTTIAWITWSTPGVIWSTFLLRYLNRFMDMSSRRTSELLIIQKRLLPTVAACVWCLCLSKDFYLSFYFILHCLLSRNSRCCISTSISQIFLMYVSWGGWRFSLICRSFLKSEKRTQDSWPMLGTKSLK